MPAFSILAIPTLTTMLHTVIAATIIALTSAPLFGARAPGDWGGFILVSLVTILACGGLGALIGSPNYAGKQWVYEQYDQQVMGDTARTPGTGSGIVLAGCG